MLNNDRMRRTVSESSKERTFYLKSQEIQLSEVDD